MCVKAVLLVLLIFLEKGNAGAIETEKYCQTTLPFIHIHGVGRISCRHKTILIWGGGAI